MAANSILRSAFSAAFPLFTTYMYKNLGANWATAVPGFVALFCVPFPIIFYRYGAAIRRRCRYSVQAAQSLEAIRAVSAAGGEKMRDAPTSGMIAEA